MSFFGFKWPLLQGYVRFAQLCCHGENQADFKSSLFSLIIYSIVLIFDWIYQLLNYLVIKLFFGIVLNWWLECWNSIFDGFSTKFSQKALHLLPTLKNLFIIISISTKILPWDFRKVRLTVGMLLEWPLPRPQVDDRMIASRWSLPKSIKSLDPVIF